LLSAQVEHLCCTDKSPANTYSQNSPPPGLGGSHHLPLYNILCVWSHGQHPNVILSQDSQVGVPKFSKLGLTRHLLKFFFLKRMVNEMLLNNDIQPFFVQMNLNFQKEINIIMYIIEFKKKSKLKSFHLNKILIKYEFQNFNKI
jgi:hypothetical protein